MKILLHLPTWLGDAVMTTPAIENIVQTFPNAQITLFGSFVSTQALAKHPNVTRIVVDDSKKAKWRYLRFYQLAQELGKFEIVFNFRRTFTANFLQFILKSPKKFSYKRYTKNQIHQVLRYNDFINTSLKTEHKPSTLTLYHDRFTYDKPTLGINPGATYGSAKRWYPERFSEVASKLSSKYDIIIFGGPGEVDIAEDIEKKLKEEGIKNYKNLAGKTSVPQLLEHIAGLTCFVTGDSGPMHVAAAYQVPTVSLFGPTKDIETSQWMNQKSTIIRHDLECAPCMKRQCPLTKDKHACMKLITPQEVIEAVLAL